MVICCVTPRTGSGSAGSCVAFCMVGGTATQAARKTVPRVPWTSPPQQEPLAVLLHFHHLEAIQVLDHFRSLNSMTVLGQRSL